MAGPEQIKPTEPQQVVNLLDRLKPLRDQIGSVEGPLEKYRIVKDYFTEHTENFATSIADLALLCTLPETERKLLTYPVVGNWVLERYAAIKPRGSSQTETVELLRELISQTRFHNHHMKYESTDEYLKLEDTVNSRLLANPAEARPITRLLNKLEAEVVRVVRDPKNPIPIAKEDLTTDLGHGLIAPVTGFKWTIASYATIAEYKLARFLGMTVMVVDDQDAKGWYDRLIAAGFKDVPGQQLYFTDPESALAALQAGEIDPDVILSDIELGEGKIDGIEFTQIAHKLQRERKRNTLFSVFSYNQDKLQEAEHTLHPYDGREELTFHQPTSNDKASFTATKFAGSVALYRKSRR